MAAKKRTRAKKRYSGKYPGRINAVWSGANRKVVCVTNEGKRYELTAAQCGGIRFPSPGEDISKYVKE